MRALQKSASLAQAALRRSAVSNNGVRFVSSSERDAIRAKFQKPDDTPVYLRGGSTDKAMFGATCVLVAIGTLHTFWRVYSRL